MLTEQTLMPQISVIDPILKSITITLCTLILKDDVEIARTNNAMTFQQGQIEEVKTFLGVTTSPEITYIESIWV